MSLDIEHTPPEGMSLADHWSDVELAFEWFTEHMIDKFEAVRHKGHWQYVSWEFLHERLWTEYQELHQALDRGNMADALAECVDVANCALMLADWIRSSRIDE